MKKMKKLLAIMLVFAMTAVMVLPQTAEAAVKLSKTKATLEVGKSTTLKLTGTKKKVTWSSSKKEVATVSAKGKVTAKAVGTATITAKYGTAKKTCKVTVKEAAKPLKSPTVISRLSLPEQKTYCVIIKNPNDQAIQLTATIDYMGANNWPHKEKEIPVLEAGQTMLVDFELNEANKGANVKFKDIKAVSKNVVSKLADIKFERTALERDGVSYKMRNDSDKDLNVVELSIRFLDSNNNAAANVIYRVEDGLKAGEEKTFKVDVPSFILGYKYGTKTLLTYAYAE